MTIKVTVTIDAPRSGSLDNPGQQSRFREFDDEKKAFNAYERAVNEMNKDPFGFGQTLDQDHTPGLPPHAPPKGDA